MPETPETPETPEKALVPGPWLCGIQLPGGLSRIDRVGVAARIVTLVSRY